MFLHLSLYFGWAFFRNFTVHVQNMRFLFLVSRLPHSIDETVSEPCCTRHCARKVTARSRQCMINVLISNLTMHRQTLVADSMRTAGRSFGQPTSCTIFLPSTMLRCD
ncbi:unnamed protein product [Ixodes persulcatus]